ncbi:MAG TPA: hypothetical protein PK079_20585 [Leptospiraceae bacterium]|nr:hypothetical protein [Leptospiraceae bacterium]HMW03621.1 hypothetical protein [Leptospiraceae bacterium]HMX31252.1 hypothetical protein [Leptospiraceae bacterium]HMY29458.1 hypothetical protein [Leptospiraceae bacterium]HMZ64745.1 hypothetical protein [Leptospiraceae bacterium]
MNLLKEILLIHFLLIGCISLPPSATLLDPVKQQNTIPEKVVIEKTNIPELSDRYRKATEDNLTMNWKDFLVKGNYFEKSILFTDKPEDWTNYKNIQLHFSKFSQERTIDPWYFPLALVTLTIYIWIGGGVSIDTGIYNASLLVKDEKGKVIYQVSKEKMEERSINIYNRYSMTSFAEVKTKLITELLEDYQLQKKGK